MGLINSLSFEAIESLQEMLIERFPQIDKEDVIKATYDWLKKYNILSYIRY